MSLLSGVVDQGPYTIVVTRGYMCEETANYDPMVVMHRMRVTHWTAKRPQELQRLTANWTIKTTVTDENWVRAFA